MGSFSLLVSRLLTRLAVRMAQVGLLVVHVEWHGFGARHASLGHRSRLGDFRCETGANIALYRQLHEQQADQCEEHGDQAMAMASGHGLSLIGVTGVQAESSKIARDVLFVFVELGGGRRVT